MGCHLLEVFLVLVALARTIKVNSSTENYATLSMTSFAGYLCPATPIYDSHSRQRPQAGTFPASLAAARFRFQRFSL